MESNSNKIIHYTIVPCGYTLRKVIISSYISNYREIKTWKMREVNYMLLESTKDQVKRYLINYLNKRIRAYKIHHAQSPDIKQMQNLLHHVKASKHTHDKYMVMISSKIWRSLLLRVKPSREDDSCKTIRRIIKYAKKYRE